MNERWKMNRIGFVNFWLYDEESFSFEDGKLLLRGQNGSGKSITTQSFIPFILDGDRNPARLDAFGTKDRRMEFYFLGEEGREEATGYLYLEFKKENPESYRTLVIGQRARRGKSMDFWGFVLLDGRRVGRDIFLYKEVGSNKIPLSRQEMKKEVGENCPFTDSPKEYKGMVNKYLFGYRKPEQYEQFIQLLIKVRAPKLSKDLNPTKIYEILNESLQTLSDEDLRSMVDAMEKMDVIQENLEQLNRACEDVENIRKEYKKYNQYFLAKKAQLYLKSREETGEIRDVVEKQEQKKKELEAERAEKTERKHQVVSDLQVRKAERDSLMDVELEAVDRKLEAAKKSAEEEKRKEKDFNDAWEKCREAVRESDQRIRKFDGEKELQEASLREETEELEELHDILQWEGHKEAIQVIKERREEKAEAFLQKIREYKHSIMEGKESVEKYKNAERQYDEQAQKLESVMKEVEEQVLLEEKAKVGLEEQKDNWIKRVFDAAERFEEWKIKKEALSAVEERMGEYQGTTDAGVIQEILRKDYEEKSGNLQVLFLENERKRNDREREKEEVQKQIAGLEQQEEIEPVRSDEILNSRQRLQTLGIPFVPFYKAVEFQDGLTEVECSRLEAQLFAAGLLDALVVSKENQERIKKEFPELCDVILSVNVDGKSDFQKLCVNEELEQELKQETFRILQNIYEREQEGEIYLGEDGSFRHGILSGRMDKTTEASYVGELARRRKKERQLQDLRRQEEALEQSIREIVEFLTCTENRKRILTEEYNSIPGYEALDEAIRFLQEIGLKLKNLYKQQKEQENVTRRLEREKETCYQKMLQSCKVLPYGRTMEEYKEAESAAEEYKDKWQEIRTCLHEIQNITQQIVRERDSISREEENGERHAAGVRACKTKIAETEVYIRQYEEYLNNPEIKEKARRLAEVKEMIQKLEKEDGELGNSLLENNVKLEGILESEEENKQKLLKKIETETTLQNYFEEELALKLVMERENKTLPECAKVAVKIPKEADLEKENGDVFQALNDAFQKHNGSLVSYGTTLEHCFENAEMEGALRRRVQVVSTYRGKKLYLEDFYGALKNTIEDTALLLQKQDREIFEEILSKTVSQQLTDRIAESRSWVKDMSALMKNMDTSMGLSFALEWKPRSADNEQEIDTMELENILLRDKNLLTAEDIEKVANHFRSKVSAEKQRAQENGMAVNYMDLVRDALDYRKWFVFQLFYYRNHGEKKILTNAAFNRFSGGEKAMAMYVPLFAAVNAQYKKAENPDHPRIIALDEAFAGVDDKNISSMFALVEQLEFDYIMNSQVLWGCFETVRGLKIAELLRPQDASVVTVIRHTWNGRERRLDE